MPPSVPRPAAARLRPPRGRSLGLRRVGVELAPGRRHADVTHAGATTAAVQRAFVNLAGNWVGTFESANHGTQSITMLVVQFDNCVDGSWRSTSGDWSGAISGFAGRDFYTGQISLERPASSPDGACQAIGNVTGEAGSTTLRWTGTGLTASRPCAGELPQSIVITMRRQ